MSKWVFPFSHKWHDEQDEIYGHLEMPLDAEGRGPEMNPDKVVRIICWCWRGEDCEVIRPQ